MGVSSWNFITIAAPFCKEGPGELEGISPGMGMTKEELSTISGFPYCAGRLRN
jgi:hypothetical protein